MNSPKSIKAVFTFAFAAILVLGAGIAQQAFAATTTTTTAVVSSGYTITYGQNVTFTATVSPVGANFGGTVQFTDNGVNLGAAVTVNTTTGVAAYTTATPLTGGSHTITAVYSGVGTGNPKYSASTGTLSPNQTVTLVSTTTTVGSSSEPSTYGSSVTFTATVSPSAAAGTVTFKDGAVTLGTGTLSGGTATYATSALTAGSHTITAVYGGNVNYVGSTSTGITQTVNQATTSTSVGSSSNPSTFGASVTFTATVSPSAAAGTVTFKDGATTLGTGTLSGGVATYATSALAAGIHTITAEYGGNANYAGSTSSGITQTVKATTSASVGSSLEPSTVGDSVTFTSTVSPSAATGTVTFKDGATTLGTGSLSGGVATYATSALTAGSHTITAVYNGDASYAGSTSSGITQTVKATTSTTAGSSSEPSTVGDSVTFTATVSPSAATGTVTFKDGATTLGTGSLSGGTATYATSALAVGAHTITAEYGGDASYAGSTSTGITQNVNQATTATSVGSSSEPSNYSSSVTFTATVSPSSAGGTVTFKDGGATIGTGTLSGGTATYATSALGIGAHTITAEYGGDASYAGSASTGITQTVKVGPISVTSISPDVSSPVVTGTNVTWTGTATGGTGSFQYRFLRSGPDTAGVYVEVLPWGVSNTCLWTPAAAQIGNNYFQVKVRNSDGTGAVYLLSGLFKVNASAVTLNTVNASPASPSMIGTPVTWSATATGGYGSYLYQYWRLGPDTSGAYVIARDWNASGSWLWTPGVAQMGANYVMVKAKNANNIGTTVYIVSSAFSVKSDLVVVNSISPSLAAPVPAGQSVTWTANVSGGSGDYLYQYWRSGPDTGGVYVLAQDWSASNTWLWNTTQASVGYAYIPAFSWVNNYVMAKAKNSNGLGASAYKMSTMFKVDQTSTATSVTSSSNTSLSGDPVTFTATVTPPEATGTVTFMDGVTTLGTGIISGGTASLITSSLSVGSHPISAVYGGDAYFQPSDSTVLGNALSFDGTDDYVSMPATANIPVGNTSYTVEAWINIGSPANQGIIGWGDYATTDAVTALRLTMNGIDVVHQGDDLSVIAALTGAWHHVAATFDGTTRTLYIDGSVAGSDTPSGTHSVPNANNLTIGVTNGTEFFTGSIDEVRVWNVARSQAEIQAGMDATLAGNELGLAALYRFDQGIANGTNTGITATPDATAANNGRLNGFALSGTTSNFVPGASVAPLTQTVN